MIMKIMSWLMLFVVFAIVCALNIWVWSQIESNDLRLIAIIISSLVFSMMAALSGILLAKIE